MGNPYLRLGNLKERIALFIMEKARSNLFFRLIYYEGPIGLLRFINELELNGGRQKNSTVPVRSCALILGPRGRQFLHKYYSELSRFVTGRIDTIRKTYALKNEMICISHTECILCNEKVSFYELLCQGCDRKGLST